MNKEDVSSVWTKVAIEVEDVTKFTREEFIKRNNPAFVDDEIDLGFHYKVCEDIKNDPDFRRKFEHCIKKFI